MREEQDTWTDHGPADGVPVTNALPHQRAGAVHRPDRFSRRRASDAADGDRAGQDALMVICTGHDDQRAWLQAALVEDALALMEAAPPVHFRTRWGGQLSVAMTSAGRFGWVSGPRGYAYAPERPGGGAWPAIPDSALAVWEALLPEARALPVAGRP